MIIAITGSFGSGKTAVAKLFRKHGYKIISADKVGHELYHKKPIKNKVIKKFGKKILTKNKINRKKLKNIVFYNNKELKKLNKIMWPEIFKEVRTIIKKSRNKKIAVDAAIIIEAKKLALVDKLVVVKINKKTQMKRLIKKSKYTKREINNILKSQLPQNKKLRYADYVIDNSHTLKHTEKQVKKIIKKITNSKKTQ